MFTLFSQKVSALSWPAVVSLTSALLLAGCGGGGGSESAPPEGAPPPIAIIDPATACSQWLPWSAPATWGGSLPTAGAQVVIPADQCIELNTDPPSLAGLTIHGALRFADTADRHLQAGWVLLEGGALLIGTPATPFQHVAQITLNAQNMDEDVMPGMGTRGILVNQGRLMLYGKSPSPAWTKLNNHAAAGATSLSLLQAVNWTVGDQVVIAPTDFYGVALTETRTVASLSGDGLSLGLTQGLTASRWGRLQYPDPSSPSGLSLTSAGYTHPQQAQGANIAAALDQRAEIGNINRSIIIQGADDALWTTHGFGGQTMFMGLNSTVVIDGVLMRRMGQNGKAGRYPAHWHMNSYGPAGVELGDANAGGRTHVMRNSVVSNSAHRCITLHGTNGLQIQNNICHNIRGHAIFIEDAVERRNVIEDNLILHVRQPINPVQLHDIVGAEQRVGASGMWITNPDNIIRRNVVADAAGSGYWYAIPSDPLGHPYSQAVNIKPRHTHFGLFEDNVAHSILNGGLLFDLVPVDAAGTVQGNTYQPTANPLLPLSESNPLVTYTLARLTTYKNRDGFWNRLNGAVFDGFVSADNTGKFFAGSSASSVLRNSLAIGTSLNDANTWGTLANSTAAFAVNYRELRQIEPPMAFASYHGGVAIYHNTVINMPYIANAIPLVAATNAPTGAFATDDYYLRPIERSLAQNHHNHLIRSDPGVRSTPTFSSFVFAGAIKDYEGLWGSAGNYWVYDNPFLTLGSACNAVTVPGAANTRSCPGEYFGAEFFVLDNANPDFNAQMALNVSRRDPAVSDNEIASWSVTAPAPGVTLLTNMRHFAMREGGVFALSFPGYAGALTDLRMTIGNMHNVNHTVVLAVQYKGAAPTVYATTSNAVAINAGAGALSANVYQNDPPGSTRIFTGAASRDDLITGAGNRFWYENGNQLVWIKLQGGIPDAFVSSTNPFSDEKLYAPFYLRVRQ